MCYHSQRKAELAELEHDAEATADRARTDPRRADDRDAPADPDDYVGIEDVTERVDDGVDATDPDDPGRTEAKPKPVGFA
ncbi:MAG: hypothetical protein ABEJ97_02145 [Halobellus sp.]